MIQTNLSFQTPLSEIDFCVIDTETTGGKAALNRIIDVAVFRFRDGQVVEKFETLINPERPIPPWITQLTNINDEMVKNAPTFSEISEPLKKILDHGVFTAHNAAFDFGFVKEEFLRLGESFEQERCCTLKLARHLHSDLPSRSLGHLCENLLIDIWDRHRASGDAEATVYVLKDFLRTLQDNEGVQTWGDLQAFLKFGRLQLPRQVSREQILRLPETPGVILFKDEKGNLVHRGQGKNVRDRVKNYFRAANQSTRSNRLRHQTHTIEIEGVGC